MQNYLSFLILKISFIISIFTIGLIPIYLLESESRVISDTSKQDQFEVLKYDPMGIQLKLPSEQVWQISSNNIIANMTETKDCSVPSCDLLLSNPNYSILISGVYHSDLSLKDYTIQSYKTISTISDDFSFIADKEIKIQDYPAWQIEYEYSPSTWQSEYEYGFGLQVRIMEIYVKLDNNKFYEGNSVFYKIQYRQSIYKSDYLPEFQDIIKSIEFFKLVRPEPPEHPKGPSFLN